MAELVWQGKSDTVSEQCIFSQLDLQYVIGKKVICKNNAYENCLIAGDNLDVCNYLMKNNARKFDCIIIDPPYNTGNRHWAYDDDYSKNGDKHSEWLSFIYPRLVVFRNMLSEKGAVFLFIDQNELAHLKLLCDEVFGEENFVAIINWQRNETSDVTFDYKKISKEVEYILIYNKNKEWLKVLLDKEEKNVSEEITKFGALTHQELVYGIEDVNTHQIIYPPIGKYWFYSKKDMINELLEIGEYEEKEALDGVKRAEICGVSKNMIQETSSMLVLKKEKEGSEQNRYYFESGKLYRKNTTNMMTNLWKASLYGSAMEAKDEQEAIFGVRGFFDTPKPVKLIQSIINMFCDETAIILDPFGGSGTTMEATVNLNSIDNGNRKCVLIEKNCVETVTLKRIEKCAQKYTDIECAYYKFV